MRRRIVCMLVLGAALGAALGGCGGSGKPSSKWDPSAARLDATLASDLGRAVPGECRDFALLERVTYVVNSNKIHAPIAAAAGSCTVLGEIVEISAFADAHRRDEFVAARGRIICERARTAKVALPGLHWVVGGMWSMQPDSEAVGRRLASALRARYLPTACPTAPSSGSPP